MDQTHCLNIDMDVDGQQARDGTSFRQDVSSG
jgi:hypothetical protein